MPKQGRLSPERHKRESGSKPGRRHAGAESGDSESHKPAEKPVSLRPLEFEEAVRDLLKTPPKPHRVGAHDSPRQKKQDTE